MNLEREKGKKALSLYIKIESNITLLEKFIFSLSEKKGHDYLSLIYSTCHALSKNKKGKSADVKKVLAELKQSKFFLDSEDYIQVKNLLEEQDGFILKPFEIEEGIFECNSCGSKKTFSYGKQTRAADEGTTTFVECSSCRKKWIISG